ncbi:hypothetical protein BC830DRAFT_274011 [Chytriomyces sp. MP71]|nr:hypothetical protein BC830DRAFT_274011 [Chytriomyces sp. MP71]
MDTDWCTCGKATKTGQLYCSDPCRVNDCTSLLLLSTAISPQKLGIDLSHIVHLNINDETLTPTLLSSFPSYDSALSSAASSFREGWEGIPSLPRSPPTVAQHFEKAVFSSQAGILRGCLLQQSQKAMTTWHVTLNTYFHFIRSILARRCQHYLFPLKEHNLMLSTAHRECPLYLSTMHRTTGILDLPNHKSHYTAPE